MSEWLKWWLAQKEHIFRTFKDHECPESNLSEVNDIAEHVTIKQMLKAYGDGGFGGGTGPNFKELEAPKLAR